MYYMGVDYHKQYSHLTILDKGGEVLRSGVVTNDQADSRPDGMDGYRHQDCQSNAS